MRKWIRWKGVFAFLGVVGAMAALWVLFIDIWVERLIEGAGSRIVGAKVELESADVSFFPLGLALSGLQVTDPERPMQNAVEVARIAFTMDAGKLLTRKTSIEEMTLEGVRLGTPRKTSGAIRKTGRAERKKMPALSMPSLALPDVGEVLKKEDLRTIGLARSLKKDMEAAEEAWKARLDELPDREKFREYEERIKTLKPEKSGIRDILGSAAELQKVGADIEKDIKRMKEAREELENSRRFLQKRLAEVKDAPAKDFERLREKYGTPAGALSNATRLLVGEKAGTWVARAISWYRKAEPYLKYAREKRKKDSAARPRRGEGMNISFREDPPVPDFLIRETKVSGEIEGVNVVGTVAGITSEQKITGVPITYSFSGEGGGGERSLSLRGKLDRVGPVPSDTLLLLVKGVSVRNAVLSESEEVPLRLEKGTADFDLDVLLRGGELDGKLKGGLRSAEFSLGGEDGGGGLRKAIGQTLKDIHAVNFTAKVTGTLEDYTLSISSDLDRVLREAVGAQLRKEAAAWEEKLRAQVRERTAEELKGIGGLGGLEALDRELSGRTDVLGGLLKDTAAGKAFPRLPF